MQNYNIFSCILFQWINIRINKTGYFHHQRQYVRTKVTDHNISRTHENLEIEFKKINIFKIISLLMLEF